MNKKKFQALFIGINIVGLLFSSVNVAAMDVLYYSSNNVRYYNPADACSAEGSTTIGTGSVGAYTNPVYNNAADPSVIASEDGKFFVYATGGILLESPDLVKWKKIADNWKLKGAPNEAGGAKWAPDIVKVGSKYILTYTIPTGTTEIGGDTPPQIAYAVGDSPGGTFEYKGKISLPYQYSIDSHIFVDDDGKIWLFWGGGEIHVTQLTFNGEQLSKKGASKQLITKGGVGSTATIEGAYVTKRNGWYYLTYSQGHYKKSSGPPAYRVLVARSKSVDGPYKPDDGMKPILEGKEPLTFPGHHSIVSDSSGTDWIVYHGYGKNDANTRKLMIDKITYGTDGWPVVNGGNGPSSSRQEGSSASPDPATSPAVVECCPADGSSSAASTTLSGNDNKEKIWNYLVNKIGLNDIQAAGVMGNIQQESGFDPEATNPDSGAYGIVQWFAGRKTALQDFAKQKNLPASDLGVQLEYLKKELDGDYYGKRVLAPLKAAKTIEESTEVWLRHFEIPCSTEDCYSKEMDLRVPFSQGFLSEYSGTSSGGGATSSGGSSGDCGSSSGGGSDFTADGMTIYNQEDPRWGKEVFGYQSDGAAATIHTSGCGPTSMATIITALTGKKVTPSQTTKYAKEKGLYVSGVGASWDLGPILAEKWGLKSKTISNNVDEINEELRKGGMIITSGTGAAPFTSAGHFITIRGVTDSGKWKIADSNGSRGQENSKKEWDPVQILGTANAGNIKVIYK